MVKSQKKEENDYFELLLRSAPASWALIRANEIKAMDSVNFKPPVLDVGCGDGVVARVVLSKTGGKFDYGIDISPKEIRKAKKSGAYKHCRIASIYKLPFSNSSFQTVFANSVIEHFQKLDKSLSEMARVLKPGGRLIMTTPSPFLSKYLLGYRLFCSLGLIFMANWYASFFHYLVKHYNIYDHKGWKKILAKQNLKLVDYYYYHSPVTIQVHEVFSYLAIPQHIYRLIVGYWPVFPTLRNLFFGWLFRRIPLDLYNGKVSKTEGGSLLLIAKWVG